MTDPWKYDHTKELEIHPLASIFPEMKGAEYEQFVEDIATNGLREPITIHEGKILEGRNRYRAMVVGTEAHKGNRHKLKDENFKLLPVGTDPVSYVLSANLHRRHLNESQRAMVAAKLVTTKLGDNQHIRKEGRSIGLATAAKMLNVSEKSVKRAKECLEKTAPELRALIEKGEVAVSAAEQVSNLPKDEQAKLAGEGAKAIRKKAKETEATSPGKSDKIDGLVNKLIDKLKEMKNRKIENADAAVADLIQRLKDADLLKKKAA